MDIRTALSYSTYAAIGITKNKLIDDLEKLLLSFLESISVAMDAKSPFGYGHINRVAKLMEIISEGINNDQTKYQDIHYNKDELTELKLAAWMHDIGKIATPESILDKSTKLETTHNRITEIAERFRSVKLSLQISLSQKKIAYLEGDTDINLENEENLTKVQIDSLNEDLFFIKQKNLPSGFMNDDDIQRIKSIMKRVYTVDGETINLLTQNESTNLCIRYGTLNATERAIINKHAKVSNQMLDMIKFPKKYENVPLIAGMHHEKLNGTGYPEGVSEQDIPFEARVLAIIDIFEALTAHDRPYKKPKTLKESYTILNQMVDNGELDGEIVNFLIESKLFEKYAKENMLKEQLVEV